MYLMFISEVLSMASKILVTDLPHPVAKAGEPTGQPPVQQSDNPFEERR